MTGNGLRWVLERSVLYGANADRRLSCFRASAPTPLGGGAVIDFGTETQDFCAWSIFEYTDVDVSSADGRSAVTQSFAVTATGQSLTATLSPSADPRRNVAVGALAVDSAGGGAIDVSPGAGYTEIDELGITQFLSKAGTLHTQDAEASGAVISWTWNSAQSAAALVLEIKAAPPVEPGSGTEPGPGTGTGLTDGEKRALVERFEPVLFFDASEQFFPSDAKRFVEHAALWTAGMPGDDKNAWGGRPGDPFPRIATVPAGSLSARADEPGDFRFDDELGAGGDHRFLELGGWKDLSESHEDGVTAQTSNRFSDRDAIAALYDADLEASRFWYHAEVIDEKALLTVASRAPGLNLVPLVTALDSPTMVCYYFFFPGHEQRVESSGCENIEAREVSSHAGDWQCMAILGEGEGQAFAPKFLGRTGLRPRQDPLPPYQYDDDQKTVMMVSAWTGFDPQLSDGHPRLYVAAGTHSLHISAGGPQSVNPYPPGQQPQHCGTLDTPSPAGPSTDPTLTATKDIAILLAKMAAAGPFGFLGATAALVSCVVEIANYRAPFAPFGASPESQADPERIPAAPGAGKTVKPPALVLADAGADAVEWRSRPSVPVTLNGRVYDCVVNRNEQAWWPHPDGLRGFHGRWGQHVTSDALARRAGPRFPNYPLMFLQALADGVSRTPPLLDLNG
ncbi:hypothetical protein GR927_30855 [Mycolicibacterium sp. 3033]|nr:hypothetical protein [Mycolicibacterium aurantiacum]